MFDPRVSDPFLYRFQLNGNWGVSFGREKNSQTKAQINEQRKFEKSE
jgi:hypothetical protein